MKKVMFIVLLLGSTFRAQAQFDVDPMAIIDNLIGPIESDRPGQALNPNTAGMLALQIQTGFNYTRLMNDAADTYARWTGVPTTIRIGLTSRIEVNTSFTYNNYKSVWNNNTLWTASGFGSPEIGARYRIMSGDGWKPYLGVQANLSFLSHNGDYQQDQMGSSFYLMSSNRFDAFSINTNFGVFFPGDGQTTPGFPWVANVVFPFAEKFSVFVEGFGEFRNLTFSTDLGVTYSPMYDLQIDLFGGMLNLENSFDVWFAELGVSYRFSFLKMLAKKKMGDMNLFE